MPVLIEACVDSVATATAAVSAGATRLELCGPGDGGTTPSPELIAACRAVVSVPLHVMIRPHDGGFVYDDDDLAAMVASIATARRLGVDGVVFGALTRGNRIASSETALLVQAAGPLPVVFHRAFDRVPDTVHAVDALLELGMSGVLTSGGAPSALDGARQLGTLREHAAGRLQIMAGGGVRGANVRDIVQQSGVDAVHARGTDSTIIADIARAFT